MCVHLSWETVFPVLTYFLYCIVLLSRRNSSYLDSHINRYRPTNILSPHPSPADKVLRSWSFFSPPFSSHLIHVHIHPPSPTPDTHIHTYTCSRGDWGWLGHVQVGAVPIILTLVARWLCGNPDKTPHPHHYLWKFHQRSMYYVKNKNKKHILISKVDFCFCDLSWAVALITKHIMISSFTWIMNGMRHIVISIVPVFPLN